MSGFVNNFMEGRYGPLRSCERPLGMCAFLMWRQFAVGLLSNDPQLPSKRMTMTQCSLDRRSGTHRNEANGVGGIGAFAIFFCAFLVIGAVLGALMVASTFVGAMGSASLGGGSGLAGALAVGLFGGVVMLLCASKSRSRP